MKKIICLILGAVIMLMVLSGCGRTHKNEIEELITDVESRINTVMVDASPMHDKGTINTELYMEIIDVKNKFTEAKNLFETTEGDQDEEILASLQECKESIEDLQSRITDLKNKAEEDIKTTADDLKNVAAQLKTYMEQGLTKGYLDQAKLDEFNGLVTRIDEIAGNPDDSEETRTELDTIRETLAVMASQCAAPNAIIDALTGIAASESAEETTAAQTTAGTETSTAAASAAESSEASAQSGVDLSTLIDNYSLLQNEASQKFDKGEIDESNYMTLLQAGTTLAALKEEVDKNGQSDAVDQRIADCQKQIKNIAEGMGSELASKF